MRSFYHLKQAPSSQQFHFRYQTSHVECFSLLAEAMRSDIAGHSGSCSKLDSNPERCKSCSLGGADGVDSGVG